MSVAPFVASPYSVVRRMLELAEIKPGETVYDLGCGDGRIVVTAAQEFGAKGVGIEIREDLADKARRIVEELNLGSKIKILCCNFFDVDISPADVVTLYLTTTANDLLKPKLERELKRGGRVVSHEYSISGWTPVKTERFVEPPNSEFLSRMFLLTHVIHLYQR